MTDDILKAGMEASLVTYSLVGALGAVVGAALVRLLTRAGDEPPIRVRGGSIKLELVHKNNKFKDRGSKKKWKLSSGAKATNRFAMYIAPAKNHLATLVLNEAAFEGEVIQFVHSDRESVTFSSLNNETEIESTIDLGQDVASEHLLEYKTAGFISEIKIGPTVSNLTTVATFKDVNQLHSVLIVEAT